MAELHVICRGGQHLNAVAFPLFDSGNWTISTPDADRLIGGWLYLHETKSQPSYFGGLVEGWRYLHADEGRIVFTFKSEDSGKNVAWKGASYRMAWSSGVVD